MFGIKVVPLESDHPNLENLISQVIVRAFAYILSPDLLNWNFVVHYKYALELLSNMNVFVPCIGSIGFICQFWFFPGPGPGYF